MAAVSISESVGTSTCVAVVSPSVVCESGEREGIRRTRRERISPIPVRHILPLSTTHPGKSSPFADSWSTVLQQWQQYSCTA